MMNLAELTPAPFASVGQAWAETLEPTGKFLLVHGKELVATFEREADCDAASLALNALDVIMRRGWTAIQYVDRTWGVVECYRTDKHPKGLGGQSWPDPFTALVESDKWYRDNVEKGVTA